MVGCCCDCNCVCSSSRSDTIFFSSSAIAFVDPIANREEGEALVERMKDLPFVVTNVGKKDGKEYAPRLFDLTSLQVECNKKFAYSADETLKLIQSLYEKKVATYPRVDTPSLIHI